MTHSQDQTAPAAVPHRRRWRLPEIAASLGLHLLAGVALLSWRADRPAEPPPPLFDPPFVVSLADPPAPQAPKAEESPAPAESAPAAPEPPAPVAPKPRISVRPAPPAPQVPPLPVPPAPAAPVAVAELSAAQLAGAATADSGGGGEGAGGGSGAGGGTGCNMVRRLQNALRRDPDIQAAAARAGAGVRGRATLVWDGDWVLSPGQEGKGLAGVRQAISMEVAFAPEACRTQTMQGLVLISMNDGPGAAKLVLGARSWRWTDLLSRRR